ncbi:MAG TPA: SDR family NAD(P)-dependent oxidoreductase [Tepidisphaeraceae bacterium]|jgi:NAD(P)-dependent dehydrogenase (short-subunit alcohol dehydrogenase family)|nr:SDR family NAD(P)-dependent oxidoreductase [Tepidisphaeraceae bacterium]
MADETVFVTGADKGLGFSLAKTFLEKGYRVCAGQLATSDQLNRLSERFGDKLFIVQQDVSDLKSVKRSAQQAAKWTDHLDILINNAGIYLREPTEKVLSEMDFDDGSLEAMMSVNAFGPMRVNQQFLPLLRQGNRKRIVNISSEAGSEAICWRTNCHGYCMSKAALNMHCNILQRWLKPEGFKILAVHPGWMQTDMGKPEADLHPDQSAAAIFELAKKDWPLDGPIFMDHTGKTMQW